MARYSARTQNVIRFIEQFCIVPEGKDVGKPVKLRTWQKDILQKIYGSPTRLIIISMGRKNAKTALTAMILLVHLVGPEARRNAQIYSAAQSRDQAGIVFKLAAKMVRMSDELSKLVSVKDTAKELVCTLTGVAYKALSAEAPQAYGLSPVLVIHDELGQVRGPRSELYEALETSMGAQVEPLSIVISTQAPTDSALLSTLIDEAQREISDTKLVFYTAPMDADISSPETWRKANPALGDFLNEAEVKKQAEKAAALPSFEASFRNLHLNQRVSTQDAFIDASVWKLSNREIDHSVFEEMPVYAGLDLSTKRDLTAFVLAAKDSKGDVHIQPYFFSPQDGLLERAKTDKVPYDLWQKQGFLITTPGKTVDYSFVAHKIQEVMSRCNVQAIAFDRWRIDDLKREIAETGSDAPLVPHGQGYKDISPSIDALEGLVLNGKLRHGDNPILTWNVLNGIVVSDPAGNRKLDKSKAISRIDGLIALTMAVGTLERNIRGDMKPIDPWLDPSYRLLAI